VTSDTTIKPSGTGRVGVYKRKRDHSKSNSRPPQDNSHGR